jgi:2-oxoisovalerate dehydrogenase E2 component (dihydrolipoyl transacylase)
MSTTITMPQLGESVAEGTIGKWLKEPGERIERDEPLVEVITDKVNAEIPSPVAGVVERIVVPEGQTVPVGAELVVIGDGSAAAKPEPAAAAPQADDSAAAGADEPAASAATERTTPLTAGGEAAGPAPTTDQERVPQGPTGAAEEAAPVAVQAERGAPRTDGQSGNGAAMPTTGTPQRASPLVRRLASEHNVDLGQVRGSGLGGRVTKNDILAHIDSRGEAAATATAPAPATTVAAAPTPPTPQPRPPAPAAPQPATAAPISAAPPPSAPSAGGLGPDEELVPLTAMRRAIAEHMVRSVQTSPHAWGMVEIDVTPLARLRESSLGAWKAREGFELTYLPFFVKAVVEALRENPVLNARWSDEGVVLKRRINIGIAVAVQDGLVVPVIRDADQKSIAGLAHAIRDLAVRGRASRLGLDDIQGGTFTVNNTGALGSIASGPIINQPQAGIITMEAIVKRPVVLPDDAIAIRSMMNACLAFDHRITDGAEALRFLQSVKRRVEAYNPETAIY